MCECRSGRERWLPYVVSVLFGLGQGRGQTKSDMKHGLYYEDATAHNFGPRKESLEGSPSASGGGPKGHQDWHLGREAGHKEGTRKTDAALEAASTSTSNLGGRSALQGEKVVWQI